MMGHNQIGWTMPAGFEEYVQHFDQAKMDWLRLYAMLGQLREQVERTQQSPSLLVQPANQPWATQTELRAAYQTAEQFSAPLVAEFSRLPQEVQKYAPKPGTEKARA
jgi:hypothetical protein